MRPLILRSLAALVITAMASAADSETLTLKDGRVLTGVYDSESGTLDMGMAKVPVKAEDIKWREKAKPTPKAEAKEEAKPAERPRPPLEAKASLRDSAAAIDAEMLVMAQRLYTIHEKLASRDVGPPATILQTDTVAEAGKKNLRQTLLHPWEQYVSAVKSIKREIAAKNGRAAYGQAAMARNCLDTVLREIANRPGIVPELEK
jgi:hypothetical protein